MPRLARRALALAAISISVACTSNSRSPDLLGTSSAGLAIPSAAGNGPHLLFVCAAASTVTTDGLCSGTAITSAATLQSALALPSLGFDTVATFPPAARYVQSFPLGYEINLWNNDGTSADDKRKRGVFFSGAASSNNVRDIDNATFFSTAVNLLRFPMVFSGYIAIPAAGADTVKSFAVATADGAFFAIQGCTANAGGTACDSAAAQTYTIKSYTSGSDLDYVATKAVFPAAGGLFPFQLVVFKNNTGAVNSGHELAWATGDQTTNLPAWTGGSTDAWSNPSNVWTLVPKASIYSPDLSATLIAQPQGQTISNGGSVTYLATLTNRGAVPLSPLTSAAGGVEFRLALPLNRLGTVTAVSVNGTGLSAAQITAATSTTATNTIITVNVASPAASDGSLLPGSANAATVSVTATVTGAAATDVEVQGMVRGHGTDPSIVNLSCTDCVTPPQTMAVYTNDPAYYSSSTRDNGNRPGSLQYAGLTSFIFSEAQDDNDATGFVVGSTTVGMPVITTFPSNQTPTTSSTTITGTVVKGSYAASSELLTITLSGVAEADCVSASGTGNDWGFVGGICTCYANGSNATWCNPINLKDCPSAAACYTVTASLEDFWDTGPTATYSFTAVAPSTTVTTPAAAAVVKSHAIKPAGTATNGAGAAPPTGTVVDAKITGLNAFTASCNPQPTTLADGTWQCSSAIIVNADGVFEVSARVKEKNGGFGAFSTPVSFTTDTKPAITAPGGTGANSTNDTTPIFKGTKQGDGPKIRVCLKSAGQCTSGVICNQTGIGSSATTWTSCPSITLSAGTNTYVAYELDANDNFSAASDDFVLTVNTTAPTVTNIPGNKTFNTLNLPFTFSGACATGQTVTLEFLTGGGAQWPTGGGSCTATCTSGAWSCAVTDIPTGVSFTDRQIHVFEDAADLSTKDGATTTAVIVDTTVPAAATIGLITPNPVLAGGANPPTVAGVREANATVTVNVTGTARAGGSVTAQCTTTGSTAAYACSTFTVTSPSGTGSTFPDGTYTVSVTQTDNHGNPQSAAANTASLTVRQQPPPVPTMAIPALIGSAGPNPPSVTGTGETGDVPTVTVLQSDGGTTNGGKCVGGAVAANGSWTCSSWTKLDGGTFFATGFPEGAYGASAKQNDTFNDSSPADAGFVVDKTPPSAPTITAPAAGSYSISRGPTVSVTTAEAAGTVSFSVTATGGADAGTCPAVAVSGSAASCALSGLADGQYTAQAIHSDAAQNASSASSRTFNVDGTTSPTPTLGEPVKATGTSTSATISGTGYPLSTITVKDQSNATICTATVAANKTWTCTSGTLADLDFTLTAAGGAPNGSGTSSSVALVIRSIPTPSLAVPAPSSATRPALTIGLTGATAGQVATVYEGATAICSVTVPSPVPSSLSCTSSGYPSALAVGNHTVAVALADSATPNPHRSLPSASQLLIVLPNSPVLTAAGTYGTNQPLLQGTAPAPGATVTIKSAADNSVICTTTAGSDASFSCQVGGSPAGVQLADGTVNISIVATSGGFDSAATTVAINVHGTPSMVPPASPTRQTAPQVCAAAQAGVPSNTTVKVLEGTKLLCSTTASASGPSCCTPSAALDDGLHSLRATLTFPPGGTSAPSEAVELRIKTSTQAPAFSGPTSNSTVKGDVVVTGTAEAGATVALTIDGVAQPDAVADSQGAFSVAVGKLATGKHTAEAKAKDFLGNESTVASLTFSVGLGGQVRGAGFGCSSSGANGAGALPLLALGLLLMLRRKAGRAALVVAAVAALAPQARAQSFALDHFRPSSGGDGFFAVEGARPWQEGDSKLQLRLWMQGLSRPLVFVADGGGETALIRNRTGGFLAAQLHAAGPFTVALQLPFLLGQNGNLSPLPPDLLGSTQLGGGIGDLRATGRMGLLRQGTSPIDLAAQVSIDVPTGGKDKYLGDGAFQGEALVALGRRVDLASSGLELLANAFVRIRPARDLFNDGAGSGIKEGSQLGLRGGVAWLPESAHPAVPARIVAELEGAPSLRGGFAAGTVPAEWRGGVTYCLGKLGVDFGAGGAMSAGIGAPALRVLGALSFGSPACGHTLRTDPVPLRPRRVEGPRATEQAPSLPATPAKVAEADQPNLDAPVMSAPSPAAEPPAAPKKAAPKKSAAVAPPPLPDLPALPLPDVAPAAEPAPKPKKERVVAKAPALPDLPALDLPLVPEAAPARPAKKKQDKVAVALPDLPALDLPALPAAAPAAGPARLAGDRIALDRPIGFEGNTAKLTPDGIGLLDAVARVLAANPDLRVEVAGHADVDSNGALAQTRANVVATYLRSKGIDGARLTVESFGTSQPLVPGISKTSRKKNLRVELNVLKR